MSNLETIEKDIENFEECECSEYDVCDVCRDYKWKEGLCYGCLDDCNPASQMCGRCLRNGY